jgi:MFS family permease
MTIVFLANGIGFGAWAGSLARVKEAFGLADTSLGVVLLLVSAGAIAGMTVAGRLAARFGTARVPVAAGLAFALARCRSPPWRPARPRWWRR